MKLFLLKRTDGADYDEHDAKVIRAKSEKQAREIANENTGDEGKIWGDKKEVTCEIVTAAGEAGALLESLKVD